MRYGVLSLLMLLSLTSVGSAGFREEFAREFLTKTWYGEQVEQDVCIECHASEAMKPAFQEIVDQWRESWHAENRISCADCHGGDPKDAALAMSPQRGFIGSPKFADVPDFCGKCHIGILKNYLDSGHGKALKAAKKAPNCVTCHGTHNIQKANIDIINEQRCAQCHSYGRAKMMKQALFVTEKKIGEVEESFRRLRLEGVYTAEDEKALFSTQAEFRTLFHTVDVSLVKERTDEFTRKLGAIEGKNQETFRELGFRKNFSVFLMLLFAGMGLITLLISKTPRE